MKQTRKPHPVPYLMLSFFQLLKEWYYFFGIILKSKRQETTIVIMAITAKHWIFRKKPPLHQIQKMRQKTQILNATIKWLYNLMVGWILGKGALIPPWNFIQNITWWKCHFMTCHGQVQHSRTCYATKYRS